MIGESKFEENNFNSMKRTSRTNVSSKNLIQVQPEPNSTGIQESFGGLTTFKKRFKCSNSSASCAEDIVLVCHQNQCWRSLKIYQFKMTGF